MAMIQPFIIIDNENDLFPVVMLYTSHKEPNVKFQYKHKVNWSKGIVYYSQ